MYTEIDKFNTANYIKLKFIHKHSGKKDKTEHHSWDFATADPPCVEVNCRKQISLLTFSKPFSLLEIEGRILGLFRENELLLFKWANSSQTSGRSSCNQIIASFNLFHWFNDQYELGEEAEMFFLQQSTLRALKNRALFFLCGILSLG